MKFYISKPKSHKINKQLINEIKKLYPNTEFVTQIYDANCCVFQKGWTKSSICMNEYFIVKEKHIRCEEAYLFTDKYNVHLNTRQKSH